MADIGKFVSTLRKEGFGAARRLFIQYEDAVIRELDEEDINDIIKENQLDTNKISDGYHTFGELYGHRIQLFITLVNTLVKNTQNNGEGVGDFCWKSRKHSDGSEWEGWFIAGIFKEKGKQITYHLPVEVWDELMCIEMLKAPEYDGHSPTDVLERLKKL